LNEEARPPLKAMVLAAGLGTRLRPLTLRTAKPALPVLNRPLLHWTLERLAAAGITEVLINLHHRPASVRRAVGDGRAFGLRVAFSHERRILGTGGGPRRARGFFGDAPLLLVNGDVLFDFDLRDLLERFRASGARAALGLRPNPDPRRYGPVVTGPRGRILSLAGLPWPARGRPWLFTGIHVLDPRLLERLPAGPSDSVRDLYAPLLAQGERLLGVPLRGAWYDLGSPRLYLESQLSLLAAGFGGARAGRLIHPQARVDPGARVQRSVLGAGAVLRAGAVVEDSVLWDRVQVGPGAQVRRSVVTSGRRIPARARLTGVMVLPGGGGRDLRVEVKA
jgi:mannose-1-phosphate guanylyltransferase